MLALTLVLLVVGAIVACFVLLPASSAIAATIGLVVITLAALVATYQYWLYAFLRRKAKEKIVVVNIAEGTGSLVLQNGEAVRFLTSKAKTDPDPSWNLSKYVEEPDETAEDAEDAKDPLIPKEKWQRDFTETEKIVDDFLPGGMRLKGFDFQGYELFENNFRWSQLRSNMPGDGKDGRPLEPWLVNVRNLENGKWVASFAQRQDFIYLKDAVYYFETPGAETKGRVIDSEDSVDGKKVPEIKVPGMAVDVRCVITLRVVNPYLTLINVHDWLESIFGLLRPSMRSWVATHYYEEIQGKLEFSEREYDEFLNSTGIPEDKLEEWKTKFPGRKPPKTLRQYIERTYGVRIKRIGFDDIVPPEAYVTETNLRAAAEQKKIRLETEAHADSNAMRIRAEGEAARLRIVAAEMKDDNAREVRRLEALEKVSEGSGSTIVLSGENANLLLNAPNKQAAPQNAGQKGKP